LGENLPGTKVGKTGKGKAATAHRKGAAFLSLDFTATIFADRDSRLVIHFFLGQKDNFGKGDHPIFEETLFANNPSTP
jgi:hypothetical protein